LAEKLALKKLQENMGNITHQEKQEQHGSKHLKGLGGNYGRSAETKTTIMLKAFVRNVEIPFAGKHQPI
jgi:hypothetical protein